MGTRQKCPNCNVTLRLPETGMGRCPRCKTEVRADMDEAPLPPAEQEALMPIIPEIGPDDEVGQPAEIIILSGPAVPEVHPAAPPPLPRRGRSRRDRDRLPAIDIANPLPAPSKVVPIALLTLGVVVSLVVVIGSFVYLIGESRKQRAAPPPIVFPRG